MDVALGVAVTGPVARLALVGSGDVKFVWHNMAFLGPESVWAAEAAECAADQGRFWDYRDKLFAEQDGENQGTFDKDNLKRFAAEIGLDTQQFAACLDSGRHAEAITAERGQGMHEGVRLTPTLFVNGRKIEGVPSFDRIRQLVEDALAQQQPGGRRRQAS